MWYVIIERSVFDEEHLVWDFLPPYALGPYTTEEAAAEEGEDGLIVESLITIDCKTEGWTCDDVYWTDILPADAEQIIPEECEKNFVWIQG